jgi:glycosyltransferase involved in cell wall biosynthesis
MQAADLLCLPSRNEGVPNVILEAFACGLPVVASRVGGIPEVHSGNAMGRLFESGKHAELCTALREVLLTPPDRQAIHRHALQFSWERAAGSYLEILRRAAGANSSY